MNVLSDEAKDRLAKDFNKRKRGAFAFGHQADAQLEKLLIRRFDRLVSIKKFIFLWVGLFLIMFAATAVQVRSLTPYYKTLQPVAGGMYSEGVIGNFSNANPIYATSTADIAASNLVFSGLFKYDKNNNLVGDLAQKWVANDIQNRYTVTLKHGITWHDGAPFNADDVIFTYHTIQNTDAQSPLYSTWQSIKVIKKDNYTVTFELPNSLNSFPYSLTNGIIPAHSFKKIAPVQMRSAEFNTNPVGTGPFVWKFVEVIGSSTQDRQQRVSLAAFDKYNGGRPKLDGFSLTTFSDDQHLIAAFKNKQINAMSGLDTVPDELAKDKNVKVYRTPLTSEVMTFFNISTPVLNNIDVRKALIAGTDRGLISKTLGYPVNLVGGPLLPGQLGYDATIFEGSYNTDAAKQALDKAWPVGPDGRRTKDGKPLEISLASQDSQEYTQISKLLQSEWGKLGVKVNVHYYTSQDLQTAILPNHDYDALLYGINIGADPDVFAYWDSSQASAGSQGHLNLSEYKSNAVDQALESGRTRSDPALRIAKYKAFQINWANDAPAMAMYQPSSLYISRGPVFNFERASTNASSDRFYNVQEWMIRQRHEINQ